MLVEQSQSFEELIQLLELTIATPRQQIVKLEQLVEPTESELQSIFR
jgi:flagellar biosynthesis chaperone FliJ